MDLTFRTPVPEIEKTRVVIGAVDLVDQVHRPRVVYDRLTYLSKYRPLHRSRWWPGQDWNLYRNTVGRVERS